ncbi:MAG: hypothetical protein CM15mV14_0450 [uncultured marine virus]|jgi:hypothetical protein|nr:MAG: hypothetical protein CM15mV14_0450 [uncultured marine virus]|tara:strand:- start:44 stop:562 length:519 start_codon:yes stop_codon:yes gene_type:complete
MNIFVTDPSPTASAQALPDKHVVKMPLETCQMLSIVCSEKWGHGYGKLHKKDGSAYFTEKGAFRHHPCTIWANESTINAWWLLAHGLALCNEYTHRYGKEHSCEKTLVEATKIIPSAEYPYKPSSFVFAGPDQFKYDKTIDIFTAYKRYIASKPWASSNYLRDPSRKPDWLS